MVGHFHLHAWLREAVGRNCVVSPEFPAGNGQVDLHLRSGEQRGGIEVRSFVDAAQLREGRWQAARYARRLDLSRVALAVFVLLLDPEVLATLSGEEEIDGVRVSTVAIG